MPRILVTGAAGFIAFHTIQQLLERGDEVVGVDNLNDYYDITLKEARLAELRNHSRAKNFLFFHADVADREAMERLFRKEPIDKVLHIAAQAGVRYSIENPYAYEEANNLGTLTLLQLCKEHGVGHFVFASSSSVYGGNEKTPFEEADPVDRPVSVYAATKRYNELLCHVYSQLYGIKCTCLRFFTVYGPWGRPDMALFKFTKAILAGEPIQVYGHGKHKRDFTYVADIVQGVIAALDKPLEYEIINLARGESRELMAYIDAIEKAIGREAKKKMLPKQPGDVDVTDADIAKARRLLGYSPTTSIAEGVQAFVDWYKEFYGA